MLSQLWPALRINIFLTILLGVGYPLLVTGISQVIFPHQANGSLIVDADGTVHGFVLNQENPSIDFVMQGYMVHVTLDEIFGNHAENGFGLIIATGKDEFIGAGKGIRVSFTPRAASAR